MRSFLNEVHNLVAELEAVFKALVTTFSHEGLATPELHRLDLEEVVAYVT